MHESARYPEPSFGVAGTVACLGCGAGLSIPDDMSIVGYDDTVSSAHLNPPLTTVEFPKREIGSEAARMTLDLAGRFHDAPPRTLTLPVRLVVRGSTAAPRAAAYTERK